MGPRAGGREEKKHNLSFVELWKYYKSEDHEKSTLRPRNAHKVDTKTTNKTTKLQKGSTECLEGFPGLSGHLGGRPDGNNVEK